MSLVLDDVVEALWRARLDGITVPPPALDFEEAMAVLAGLVRREVDGGEEIVGWKIARLPDAQGEDVLFAGPVFAGSLVPASRALVAPRVETEYVARIKQPLPEGGWATAWHLGFEIVDNHSPDWSLDPAWAVADWGLHAGAILGDPCAAPVVDAPVSVRFRVDDDEVVTAGAWRTGHERMHAILERDCARLARPLQAGDLVWSGALFPPVAISVGDAVEAVLDRQARVVLGHHNFWGGNA